MTWLTPEFGLQLVVMLFAAAAVYGGIRADLKHLHDLVDRNSRATAKAHERIDKIFERRTQP